MSSTDIQASTYAIDSKHSSVEFVVRHLMISKVRGRFTNFTGTVNVPAGSDVPSAVSATIEAASLDTREPQRDAHLKSGDFFDVEKFPELSFESTSVSGSDDDFKIHGNLTIHGVTREVDLAGSFEGRGADPWGGQRIAYAAHVTVNRKDFGLNWNQALETGGVVVSDEVRIELEIQAVLSP